MSEVLAIHLHKLESSNQLNALGFRVDSKLLAPDIVLRVLHLAFLVRVDVVRLFVFLYFFLDLSNVR